jgi:16S rRNA (uracil1498-N3)-methyltransferase
MQFTYHKDAGVELLTIEAELHKYLFKVRRHNSTDKLYFRNLNDKNLYTYIVEDINRRKSILRLIDSQNKQIEPIKKLHIGWCLIDVKSIEKVIASLNELGVDKITFITCEYSQKQYKINFEKLNKLLVHSSQQSGRSSIIDLDHCESLEKFINNNPDTYMFNFSQQHITTKQQNIKTIVIGCEGGFSTNEIENFKTDKIVGIDSNLILRSETATITIASTILI